MISLAPLKNSDKIKAAFAENGLSYTSLSGCVTAVEKENTIGFCLYSLDDDKMVIESDLMLADGILRSTLHVAAERGVMNAFYTDETEELSRKLAFIKDKAEKRLDIDKLFKSCHDCAK